jgi:Protein of unknown function (DUF751)
MFDGFWENISRYPRYFVTIILGVFVNAFAPIIWLFKRPSTAIVFTLMAIAAIVFTGFTLRAMLGLNPV